MKGPLRGFLFDFDGVLSDSLKGAHEGVCNVCRQSGVPEISFEEFLRTFHAPYLPCYRKLGVVAPTEDISRWYKEVARHHEARMFPDALELTKHLVLEHRSVIGIITAQREALVMDLCWRAGIKNHISYLVGQCEHKDEAITTFCKRTGIPIDRTWFFGDMPSDMRDAKLAGVLGVGVTRGNPTKDLLIGAGAIHCIEHLSEVPALVCCRG